MAKFAKGVSGNPGGRPKGEGDIRELARQHTPQAIRRLVKVMNDDNATASAQVAASTALLDRGWGRPAQTINATVDAGQYQQQVEASLADSAMELLKSMRGTENTRGTDSQPTPGLGSEPSSFAIPEAGGSCAPPTNRH